MSIIYPIYLGWENTNLRTVELTNVKGVFASGNIKAKNIYGLKK